MRITKYVPTANFQERVAIQTRTATLSEFGDETETWATANTVWAEVLPQNGREFNAARQIQPELTHILRLRYSSSTKPTVEQRISWESRILHILAVINEGEENRYVQCICKEIVL